jgi:Gpi18-like mannosyltransferase
VQNTPKHTPHAEAVLVAALLLLAVLARAAGWQVRTEDMHIFFQWYYQLREAGWRGLGTEIGNYNAPFIYLLGVVGVLPGPLLVKMKAVFVLFDAVLAFFSYRIVGLRWPGRRIPTAAALLVLLLPTVVINASFYGQMDAAWASCALGGVYFLLRGKPWSGVALCGIAVAVKPQGVFVVPLLLLLALAGRLPWRTLLAAPAVFVALDLPAILAGRDPVELLTVYDLGRQAQNGSALSRHAPSIYAFVPAGRYDDAIRLLGLAGTAAIVLGICWVLIARAVALTDLRVVTVTALFALLLPFLLPGMHERYFFLADVTTVVLAVFRPRLWFVPLLVQAGSLLAYQPYLFGRAALPMTDAATLMLAAVIVLGYVLLRDAFAPADAGGGRLVRVISRPAGRPVPLPVRPV